MDYNLLKYSEDNCRNWNYLDTVLLKVQNSHSSQNYVNKRVIFLRLYLRNKNT